jgi:hypothetical protein
VSSSKLVLLQCHIQNLINPKDNHQDHRKQRPGHETTPADEAEAASHASHDDNTQLLDEDCVIYPGGGDIAWVEMYVSERRREGMNQTLRKKERLSWAI